MFPVHAKDRPNSFEQIQSAPLIVDCRYAGIHPEPFAMGKMGSQLFGEFRPFTQQRRKLDRKSVV